MFILGLKNDIVVYSMSSLIPKISEQIYAADTLRVLENRYSTLGPMWVTHQMEWNNAVYTSFKDHDKFLIIIFLIKKTLNFYSKHFIKLSFDEFYSKDTVEIERFSVSEISDSLLIPKESARRKILELEKMGVIKKIRKKIIIDRSKFFYTKPNDSIKRISRFMSSLSEMCEDENVLKKAITSSYLEKIIKDNFSYIWEIYYELQIPMMMSYKLVFKDLESFHIFGTCIVNQHLHAKKITNEHMSRESFIKILYQSNKMQGLNAMSISDITGIPRATVIRKLKNLVNLKYLAIDNKKHYKLTGNFVGQLKPLQENNIIKLSKFSAIIYNLTQ